MQHFAASQLGLEAMQIGGVFLLLALAVAVWHRQSGKLGQLQRQLETTEKAMRRFMEETEETILEICRLMTHDKPTPNGSNEKVDDPESIASKSSVSIREISMPTSWGRQYSIKPQEIRKRVLNLSERGVSPSEICSRLNVPRGEIELIMNLKNKAGYRETNN